VSLTVVATAPPEPAPAGARAAIEGRSPGRLVWERLRHDRVAIVSVGCIVFMALLAICAPLIALATGHGYATTNLETGTSATGTPLGPGSNGFLLGGDDLGRDVLVRIAYGARISLLVGVLATVFATVVGVVVGLISGYFGGVIDSVLARIMDMVLSFPYLLFALALVSVLGPSLPLTVFVIAFFSWGAIGRIVRGQALSQKEKEYVEAAHSLGAGNLHIMFVDILPNLVAPVIVLATLLIPAAITFEAALSFLGLGVQPPTPSWGNMLADAQSAGYQPWWFWLFPALALLITTLSFNLLGDSLRDALDPGTERIFAMRRKKKGKEKETTA
jgi:peptide/nickel transport system permease protein